MKTVAPAVGQSNEKTDEPRQSSPFYRMWEVEVNIRKLPRTEVTPVEKLVLFVAATHARGGVENITISQETWATEASLGVSTVRAAIKRLVETKLLIETDDSGRTKTYRFGDRLLVKGNVIPINPPAASDQTASSQRSDRQQLATNRSSEQGSEQERSPTASASARSVDVNALTDETIAIYADLWKTCHDEAFIAAPSAVSAIRVLVEEHGPEVVQAMQRYVAGFDHITSQIQQTGVCEIDADDRELLRQRLHGFLSRFRYLLDEKPVRVAHQHRHDDENDPAVSAEKAHHDGERRTLPADFWRMNNTELRTFIEQLAAKTEVSA